MTDAEAFAIVEFVWGDWAKHFDKAVDRLNPGQQSRADVLDAELLERQLARVSGVSWWRAELIGCNFSIRIPCIVNI